jgi:hypothetical protein
MLRVAAGHYRDSFRRIVYDVYRVKSGIWSFRTFSDTVNSGGIECESKAACERIARLCISDALDNQKK